MVIVLKMGPFVDAVEVSGCLQGQRSELCIVGVDASDLGDLWIELASPTNTNLYDGPFLGTKTIVRAVNIGAPGDVCVLERSSSSDSSVEYRLDNVPDGIVDHEGLELLCTCVSFPSEDGQEVVRGCIGHAIRYRGETGELSDYNVDPWQMQRHGVSIRVSDDGQTVQVESVDLSAV